MLAIICFCSRYLQLRADAEDGFDSALFYTGTPAAFMISVSSRVRSACRAPVKNVLISTGLTLNWLTRVRRSACCTERGRAIGNASLLS